MPVECQIDLREQYPNNDEWFYRCDTRHQSFSKPNAVCVSTRTVQRISAEGVDVYRKWDNAHRSGLRPDGAKDKIAADLASILGINVPQVLLWKSREGSGCIQKEPPHFDQPLSLLLEAVKVDPEGGKPILDMVVSAYNPANAFFDAWLCNVDRHANYGNTLLSETSTSYTIWLIDFDLALGTKNRPWTEQHCEMLGLTVSEAPAPQFIWDDENWRRKVQESADTLQRQFSEIDESAILEICCRAFSYYDDEHTQALGETIGRLLICRRVKINEWLDQLQS